MGKTFDEVLIGDKYTTKSHTLKEADLDRYLSLVNLKNPLFTDFERAEMSEFKGRVVPGPLTIAQSLALLDNLGTFSESLIALLEFTARFVLPVRAGDTIQVVSEIAEKVVTTDGKKGIIVFSERVRNQDGKAVVELSRKILFEGIF